LDTIEYQCRELGEPQSQKYSLPERQVEREFFLLHLDSVELFGTPFFRISLSPVVEVVEVVAVEVVVLLLMADESAASC